MSAQWREGFVGRQGVGEDHGREWRAKAIQWRTRHIGLAQWTCKRASHQMRPGIVSAFYVSSNLPGLGCLLLCLRLHAPTWNHRLHSLISLRYFVAWSSPSMIDLSGWSLVAIYRRIVIATATSIRSTISDLFQWQLFRRVSRCLILLLIWQSTVLKLCL